MYTMLVKLYFMVYYTIETLYLLNLVIEKGDV